MAMLDRYDISNLPAPMSRGEKLLYKIAVGETDLSDVSGYLSRYEELLKYLIENGENSEDDFEYVLYTLNQSLYTLYTTAEKPVKSAILKGQTLVNLLNFDKTDAYGVTYSKDGSKITASSTSEITWASLDIYIEQLKSNTNYILMVDDVSFTHGGESAETVSVYYKNWNVLIQQLPSQSSKFFKFYIASDVDVSSIDVVVRIHVTLDSASISTTIVDGIRVFEYQDGMENWDIPYFEGMQSVKMPVLKSVGKNLFDGVLANGSLADATGEVVAGDTPMHKHTQNYIKVKPNTDLGIYYETDDYNGVTKVYFYDKDKKYLKLSKDVSLTSGNISEIIHVPAKNNICYMRMRFFNRNNEGEVNPKNIMIAETSDTITTYEPHKSNILSCNEEVELRGIGDVRDTLDLMTGEVVERIGEIVIDGSDDELWGTGSTISGSTYGLVYFNNGILANIENNKDYQINNRGLFSKNPYEDNLNSCWLYKANNNTTQFRIMLDGTQTTIDDFKTYAKNNPITIQYKLATESIKTVDLSVVDQDSNPTKLGTFENITHVSLESEGLIPTLEIKVGTIISEELTSANSLMDDISVEQQNLSETIDEQSDNIDTTMMATTEIYENTL